MCTIINGLPEGLTLDGLRPVDSHADWARDETVFSPDGQFFAIAYHVVEVTMMSDMGGVAWGGFVNGLPQIIGHLPPWSIYCWSRPFCAWPKPQVFVVKLADQKRSWPLLAINVKGGFQIVGTNALETRPSHIVSQNISDNGWSSTAPLE